jgi:hypothetical protein
MTKGTVILKGTLHTLPFYGPTHFRKPGFFAEFILRRFIDEGLRMTKGTVILKGTPLTLPF